MKKSDIEYELLNPRKEARNLTRWWWYGCAVDKEEIVRELDFMNEAGIGGVELQILYPLQPDDKEKNRINFDYLSPEYFEMIRYAADEANRRGMRFDLTLGSSWPFGGPFIPEELSGQSIIPYEFDVNGPCTFTRDLTTVVYGKIVGAVLGKMENAQMIPESVQDIRDKVVDKYLFNWPWGTMINEIEVPAGLHKIILFISSDKRQRVLKPLKGGEGLILDHNRKESLRCFLKYAGDPIIEAVGQGKIQNIFCDSLEVFGHNWTEILYDEFKKRRGYDLHPFIYALWGEMKDITTKVRYDFQKTMAELTVENFFEELTKWSHEQGTLSRIQAHGTWGDVLKAYGAADIPEGETFSAFDKYEVNTIHRRLAVSAGHLYDKPIISNESFTWLRFPRFVVNLENIKEAVDSIFLDGINQIVNHGYSYSKDDGEMLAFYASCNINHNNTWWKYYKYIAQYINRVCHFMQKGQHVSTTAIYLPQHDIWAETPIADTHMCMKLKERLGVECIDSIQKAGYWFDFVNDDALLNMEKYPYDILILIECERIPVETMGKIKEFADHGGKVIVAGDIPRKSCGYIDYEEMTKEIVEIGEHMISGGKLVVVENKYSALIEKLKEVKRADIKISNHPNQVGYVHRRTDKEDLFFISNISKEDVLEKIEFPECGKEFCVFDPMTGQEKEILSIEENKEGVEVDLNIEANQSLIFIFSEGLNPVINNKKFLTEIIEVLDNGFEITVDEKNFSKKMNMLSGWEQENELRYYSGSVAYTKEFTISDDQFEKITNASEVVLSIDELHEIAEVYINGTKAGDILMHPYRIDITGLLTNGINNIKLVVTNCLINRMIDSEYKEEPLKPIINEWPYATGAMEEARKERLYNWRERDMIKEPVKSGILGEVVISVAL